MARIVRNISAIVFLITVGLTPVSLQAQTCSQYGTQVVGPYCQTAHMCAQWCLEEECMAWAAPIGEDCFNACLHKAEEYCGV